MENIIMLCAACFLIGVAVGGLSLVVVANIAHARDVKKALKKAAEIRRKKDEEAADAAAAAKAAFIIDVPM